jgi:hypothetical protein
MPDELTAQVGCASGGDGSPVVFIVPTWCGRPELGERWAAPFYRLGTLLDGSMDQMAYGTSLTAFDAFLDNGRRTFMETCWIPAFDNDCAAVFTRAMETAVSPGCAIFTHEFKGAAACVSAEATAFGLRRDHVLIEILATCDEVDEQPHRQWASATRRAFEAMALPGGYPNLLAASDVDRAGRSYGPNAGRLVKAKRIYDPDNIFSSAIPLPAGENGDGRKRLASAR